MCGECLNNYYVYDTATSVKEISKEITAIYNMFQMIIRLYKENSFEAMIRYLKLGFLQALINFEVEKVLANLTRSIRYVTRYISIKGNQDAVIMVYCNFRFEVCLPSSKSQTFLFSKPCRSLCNKHLEFVQELYHIAYQLKKVHVYDLQELPTLGNKSVCSLLPEEDITHIERCQRLTDVEQNHTKSCYVGHGSGYVGFINVTSSGKTCQPWSVNSYLQTHTYPTLTENFCRNPQGYLLKPWCYTDNHMQHWEYCDVKKCIHASMTEADLWKRTVWIVLITTALSIVALLLIYFARKYCKRFRKQREIKYTSPYAEYDINDKKQISKLLSLPQIDTRTDK